VLEMFFLMDRLLKGVNQDYRLTPYKALACSRSDGYVEFVSDTRTFQETNLKEYLNKLVEYNSPIVMENYVYSCAGYCAITYFFGIGDRHLENLLISSSGKMLHIDFGFILGRDPKPYPPPIKIRKDMIDAMGGIEHDNFKIFKAKCLEAFLYLRKHSKVVYNMVFLMLDSGLKDVHAEGINKLYDKFAVEMNDT
jgi:phosphatidylinositol 3-kinase